MRRAEGVPFGDVDDDQSPLSDRRQVNVDIGYCGYGIQAERREVLLGRAMSSPVWLRATTEKPFASPPTFVHWTALHQSPSIC
jgi:hypothetical protein